MKLKYWVTRNEGFTVNGDKHIIVWTEKPFRDEHTYKPVKGIEYFSHDNKTSSFLIQSISDFKKNFGFVPEKGTCQEVTMDFTLVR